MISLEGIKEAHSWVSKSCINKLVNLWYQEGVFQTSFIQVCEVNAYSPFSILLSHYYRVVQPPWIVNLFDSPSFLKLIHFFFCYFYLDVRRPVWFLLLWKTLGVNIKSIAYEFWIYPRRIIRLHANTSKLFIKNSISSTFSEIKRLSPSWKYLSLRSIGIFSSRSHISFGGNCNCYNESTGLTSSTYLRPMAATWHLRALL